MTCANVLVRALDKTGSTRACALLSLCFDCYLLVNILYYYIQGLCKGNIEPLMIVGVNFLTYIVYIHTCKTIHWYIRNIFWPKNDRWDLVFTCHWKCHLSFKIFTCHNDRHDRSCAKACLKVTFFNLAFLSHGL